MGSFIDALAELNGHSRQEVLHVFQSCATTDPDRPDARLSIELTDVEKALGMPPGCFRIAIGRA
ncbi:hypothetical protein SAMN04488542_10569 [Fontibacillus panacisegetis]|uniref:Uncharacterized protein n=1 Tax=Fontibacillus panacisegetis TaxID=670482 RepID=A0A1G7HXS0_9BACL|nr:hypothetical protein [Fontibacillus panacisegetis]SDF05036.1 hypothetical protein SAMN04488542_10569 [Fontibacillus panacisegetis]